MNIPIYNAEMKEINKKTLPPQFGEEVRLDLIRRAYNTAMTNSRQAYGSDPDAGKKQAAKLSRRRRDFRGAYGKGISRVPRKILSRRGTQFSWTGAFAPGTVGGRAAHPPKAWKVWGEKINNTERRKAIRSALAATMQTPLVTARGHRIPSTYPFALASEVEQFKKTKQVYELLQKLGFNAELQRTLPRKIRAGKGKARGRKYVTKKGILLVVSDNSPLASAARNIVGVDVTPVANLNARVLAPGGIPGRCTIFTDKALDVLLQKKLFA